MGDPKNRPLSVILNALVSHINSSQDRETETQKLELILTNTGMVSPEDLQVQDALFGDKFERIRDLLDEGKSLKEAVSEVLGRKI